jgi:serine/threonine-protein kinase
MDSARFRRLQELFHEAAGLPESERHAYLSNACGNDSGLIQEVLGMLERDSSGDSFLDSGVAGAARDLLEDSGRRLDRLEGFGPYRLKKLLGEGGMGAVYLAEREDLGSLVAVKFLRDAWMSPARRDRFAIEQRTMAALNHPAIARLHDASALADGTPWFVMEYVEGVPITEYAAQHNSTPNETLRLFRQVCEAVQYLHEHAVIHRDLKPSNILVKPDGSVRLLDFGIAKHLESPDRPVDQTRTALRMMTPAYAAPEQVRGEGVGVFTDVYALGVLLYELLAGKPPLDLTGKTAGEAEKMIVEQQPEKPSASPRRAGPPGNRGAWADLDVLCLTAMHKDAQRRYRSAEMLIRDIDHYLKGEPLEARPDTVRYRLGKFVRRNRRAVVSAAMALSVLAGMAVFFTVRLAKARDAAVVAAERTRRVQSFMLNLFGGGDKSAGPAEGLRVTTLMDRGVQEAQTLQRDPALQADLYQTLGGIYEKLGKLDRADDLLHQALEARKQHGADDREISESLVALGLLRTNQAKLDEAERLVREGLTKARDNRAIAKATFALGKVLEARGAYAKAIPILEESVQLQTAAGIPPADLAEALKELADAEFYAGHYDRCEQLTQRSLALHRQAYGDRHPMVADDLINLGAVQFERGKYPEAEAFYRQALAVVEPWYGKEHPETASTLSMPGRTLIFEKRMDEAVAVLEQSLKIQEGVYGPAHPKVANILNELANVALQRGRLEEAEPRFRRMVDIYKKAYGDKHYLVALSLSNLASVYLNRKDYRGAEALYREAIARYGQTLAPDHLYVGIARIKLGRVLVREQRYQEAETDTLAGYSILMKQASPSVTWLQSARQDLVTIYEALHSARKSGRIPDAGKVV